MRGVRWGSLVLAWAFLFLQACDELPVPVGDPEKSRIDADLAGIWFRGESDGDSFDALIFIAEPYDRRTWLLSLYTIEGDLEGEESQQSLPFNDFQAFLARISGVDTRAQGPFIFKAWTTQLGGELFVVLEPKANPSTEHGLTAVSWLVHRFQVLDGRTVTTLSVNDNFENLGEAGSSREAEAIIGGNARNPRLYDASAGVPEQAVWRRVDQADLDRVASLLRTPD